MKKYAIILVLSIFGVRLNSQTNLNNLGLYSEEDNTVYTVMRELVRGNQTLSTLGLLPYYGGVDRPIELEDGEGKSKFAILDANIDLVFPVWGGRPQARHRIQKSLLSIHYNPGLRMYLDDSSPIVPTNQKIGFQAYYIFNDNTSNPNWCPYVSNENCDFPENRRGPNYFDNRAWSFNQDFRMHYLIANAMHYSNGQAGFPQIYSNIVRNNYKNGNFSTNYINVSYVFTRYNFINNTAFSANNHSVLSVSVGYQRDGEVGGPLAYDVSQHLRYGYNRVIGFIQWRTGPISRGQPIRWSVYDDDEECETKKVFCAPRVVSHLFRLEFETILGNLSRYNHDYKSRFNAHLFYEYSPYRWRTASFMAHLYFGRDYLNIRYDDIMFTAMVGLTLDLNKYRDPSFGFYPIP